MKKKDLSSLRNKSLDDLKKAVSELNVNITKTLLDQNARRLKNTNAGKLLLKDLAQTLTALREKELGK